MKAPAFQFYAGDFLVSTAMMSAEEVGGYIRLLCYQWTQGSLPNDDAVLARLSGCDGNAVASIRHKFGIDSANRLANARLEEVRLEQEAYRKKQAENAKNGWQKRKKPRVGNATADATAMPPHMPNECSSVFSLQSSNNTIAPDQKAPAKADAKATRKPRVVKRNPVLDALATIGGGKAEEVPPGLWSAVAKALSEIRAVCPDVTVDELRRRADNYRSHFPDAALTHFALAKHWATAGSPKSKDPSNSQAFTGYRVKVHYD